MPPPDLREDAHARRARKRPLALRVTFADADGTLKTREGPVTYRRGDALLTGTAGEQWPVPRERFDATYDPVAPLRAGKPGTYRKRPGVVWAKRMRAAFAVELSDERGTLRGDGGDWLVQYAPGDLSVVDDDVFERSYELLD
jgi:hypothetical protein